MQTTAGRPKDLEKRKQILQASKALFLKNGYHGSSMNQIAKEAGVTKLTVYNHFKDKENLFTCAIEETCEESISARPLTLEADCNFQQAFFHACELALNVIYLPEALKLEHLLLELAAEQNPLALQFYNASHQRMCLVWQDFFQQAIQLGFIRVAEIEKQTDLILSLLLGLRHHEVLLGIRQPPTAFEKQYIILDSMELFLLKYNAIASY
ncbi:TetR/AcrR family transcriptional regulator [Acinetobacter sp. ANC 4648]|uniref:TetR/AcrR family transcriptional regulator n=1 Tax=Acinetobacter sp. ANC 4648 TaxID=1977875 RepID=UPI000A35354D|nr:TetR/AcrR family transcriptional regulator [Acinetobacter sp. ANC 4648]OTG85094.1 TetR family transcriptional regulator [Acinetobacter sp. ANC 4648]